MKFIDKTTSELLATFQSPDPTPGGGSASALAGALGASLLVMVAGLPKPRATGDDETARLAGAGTRCRDLAARLSELVDADSAAYEQVMAAYRRPKGTDAEKAARSQAIQDALRVAIDIPLGVMRAAGEAIEQAIVVARLGNANAASDVRVALELLAAGLRGAQANVAINLESVKDAAYAAKVRADVADLERGATERAESARGQLP